MLQEAIYLALAPMFADRVYPGAIPEKINGQTFIISEPVVVFLISSTESDLATQTLCGPGLAFTRFAVRLYGPNYMDLWQFARPVFDALNAIPIPLLNIEERGRDIDFDNVQNLFGIEITGHRLA